MRIAFHSLVSCSLLFCGSQWASGQDALDRLEKKQFGAEKAQPKVDPAAKGAEPGYLGVVTDDAEDRGRGVRVTDVVAGSPAQAAGLKIGDLITGIDGQPIRQMSDVPQRMKGAAAGTKLGVTVVRGTETRTIHVTLGRRPNDPKLPPPPPVPGAVQPPQRVPGAQPPAGEKPPPPPGADRPPAAPAAPGMIGIVMRSYADDPRLVLGRPPIRGVQITEVLPDSPAAAARLSAGDIIVGLNDQPTGDLQELRAGLSAHRAGEQVELTFYRGRLLIKQKVRLAAAVQVNGTTTNRPPAIRPGPLPPPPLPGGEGVGDQARIEALERRVRELERRIEELEKKQKPAQ